MSEWPAWWEWVLTLGLLVPMFLIARWGYGKQVDRLNDALDRLRDLEIKMGRGKK